MSNNNDIRPYGGGTRSEEFWSQPHSLCGQWEQKAYYDEEGKLQFVEGEWRKIQSKTGEPPMDPATRRFLGLD